MSNFKYKIPAILYSMLIFGISSIPQTKLPRLDILNFDKLNHLIEYTFYAMTLFLAFSNAKSEKIIKYAGLLTILTGLLFGITDEIHQIFVPGREFSMFDYAADTLGILLGVFIYTKFGLSAIFKKDLDQQST
jgi:VanZ family protein